MTYQLSNVLPSPFDARDYQFAPSATGLLPRKLSVRQYIPDEEDQSTEGSCVAHTAVACCELHTNRAGKWEDLSRSFPYYVGRELTGMLGQQGMFPRSVLEAGRKAGFCLEREWPYDLTRINERPADSAYTSGATRKIKRYERIPLDPDRFMVSINNIKAALAEGLPVMIAMKIGMKFFDLKGALSTHNYISHTSGLPGTEYAGNHMMLLVEADDDLRGGSFVLQNWWGAGWGDRGYGAIGYTLVSDMIEAWVIREMWDGIAVLDPAKHARQTKIAQLYACLFGRAPEREGMVYWSEQLVSKSLQLVAQEMYNCDPARAYYPYTLTNEQIVARFYANVLGRQADAEGLAYWTAELNSGMTPGQVITNLIAAVVDYRGSDPMALASQRLLANKTAIGLYYAVDLAGNNISIAKLAFDKITDAPESLDAAKDHVIQLVGWV
jgi:hypothetical protein